MYPGATVKLSEYVGVPLELLTLKAWPVEPANVVNPAATDVDHCEVLKFGLILFGVTVYGLTAVNVEVPKACWYIICPNEL